VQAPKGPLGVTPGAAGGSRGGVAGAIPLNAVRQRTSRELLNVSWDYPVYVSAAESADVGGNYSRAKTPRKALPLDKAYYEISQTDQRPLLVLRECDSCEGTDDALLSTRFDNEKTMLKAQWFHLVKLPTHVTDDSHPFHNLFGEQEMPHLFLASHDGTKVVPLDGGQSQTDLWRAMDDVLEHAYLPDHERSLKKQLKLLDALDGLDEEENRLAADLDNVIEKKGPKSPKAKSLRKKLEKVRGEREEALTARDDVASLKLKPADD